MPITLAAEVMALPLACAWPSPRRRLNRNRQLSGPRGAARGLSGTQELSLLMGDN